MHSSNRSAALLTLLGSIVLSGCGSNDFDSGPWFQKPLDLVGRQGGYTYSELQEARQVRPITANDLIQANGACPQRAPLPVQTASNAPMLPGGPAAVPAAEGLVAGGVALGMSECDVVARAGQPSAVQIGQKRNGDRTALLTIQSGPQPGIYRFERGRLMEIDQTDTPPPPPPAHTAKKRPAKPKKPDQNG